MKMEHPTKCDCSRCRPPAESFIESHDKLRYLDDKELKRESYNLQKQKEERVLEKIKSTFENSLFVPEHGEPEHDKEVKAVLDDTIDRFKNGKKHFTTLEIQIAFYAWQLMDNWLENPPYSLCRLVLGTVVEFSDSKKFEQRVQSLKGDDTADKSLLAQLIPEMKESYSQWLAKLEPNPDAYLVCFMSNTIAKLLRLSQEMAIDEINPPVDMFGVRLPDCEVRKIMQQSKWDEKSKYPAIFNMKNGRIVRPPYWPVLLATDSEGRRYFSNEKLDILLPDWERLLKKDPQALKHFTYWLNLPPMINQWIQREKEKLEGIGIKAWPSLDFRQDGEMGNPETPSEVWTKVTSKWRKSSKSHNGKNNGKTATKSKKSPPSNAGPAAGKPPASHSLEASQVLDNDLDSRSETSDLGPDSHVSENSESDSRRLNALESVMDTIRDAISKLNEEHHSRLSGFQEDIERRLKPLEKNMHTMNLQGNGDDDDLQSKSLKRPRSGRSPFLPEQNGGQRDDFNKVRPQSNDI
ncbi:hypothetical protein N7466_005915 [Penicillium verhagenii]|uniref:uncharacterized protein n=1 Tax=Penicillium verhagenii TaxID=1562060 RepID=UPI0025451A21|nr:uncharacterized protein N7466_005915 [Penicillium verhagenii]KAJ5930422.1 hypothetical protein N7466_005915 [Penicillium verhagenii]